MFKRINVNKQAYRRVLLVYCSDTHAGSKFGLMHPESVLHEEDVEGNIVGDYTPELTASQQYLWDRYDHDVHALVEIAGKDEIIVTHNGDCTQGDKYPQELVSTRRADQYIIAKMNMSVWLGVKNVQKMRLAFGTQSHEFGEGTSNIIVTELLRTAFPNKDVRTYNHGLKSVDGFTVDFAHHGAFPGSRVWLKGNEVRYYTKSMMLGDLVNGRKPPHLIVRSHYHEPVEEWVTYFSRDQLYKTATIITPSYQLMGAYSRQVTRQKGVVTVGMVGVEIVDNKIIDIHWMIDTKDIRTKEEL